MGRKLAIIALILLAIGAIAVYLGNSIQSPMKGASREAYAPNPVGSAPRPSMNTTENASTSVDASRPDPNEVIFCDVLHDRAARSDCDYYDEILADLEYGGGGIDAPDAMVRGDTATVSFAVSENPTEEPVREFLGAKPKQEVALKVGRKMAAELRGDGFKIEPAGLQKRDLFIGKGARWDWQITALKAPTHRLRLSAYVVVSGPDGSDNENLLKTLELPLTVTVTWGQRFDDFITETGSRMKATTAWVYTLIGLITALGALATALGLKALIGYIRRKKAARSEN